MKTIGHLTYCEIDLRAVEHNLNEIVKLASKNKFSLPTRPCSKRKIKDIETVLAVVKADAYGHGVNKIAALLDKKGVGFFGVSDIHEGVALREAGIKKPILLFGVAGFSFLALAGVLGIYLLVEFFRGTLNPDRPLMTVLILLIIGGLQFVSLGLVGTQIVQLRKEVYRIQMENRRLERQISGEKR